jgi:glycosyltransferase involved in cell wall biosynthesis
MKPKVAIIISSPMMVNFFLISQINHLCEKFEITLITGISDNDVALNEDKINKKINIIRINMQRKISLFFDIITFFRLVKIFKIYKFDIVHSISPKSGLLAQIAAFFFGIQIRVHTFTGQVWASKSGLWRYLLKLVDRLIVKVSSNILVDSYSQRSFLMSENVVNHDNSKVLLNGSISGINEERFTPSQSSYRFFREENGLRNDSKIILFLGRLTKDKGVVDLILAFQKIILNNNNCYLLLVGPDEDNIVKKYVTSEQLNSKILCFEYTDKPEFFMQVSDLLCLPSLREGFGNVVLEAAMCKVPAVVSDIYGLKDVIEKDVTAFTFSPGNISKLTELLTELISNNHKINEMGDRAHKRAKYLFSTSSINESLVLFYNELLNNSINLKPSKN